MTPKETKDRQSEGGNPVGPRTYPVFVVVVLIMVARRKSEKVSRVARRVLQPSLLVCDGRPLPTASF